MLLHLLIASLASVAFGAPTVRIEAEVGADLRTVSGTIHFPDGMDRTLVDPLALLPEPADDRSLFRTYPGAPDRGTIRYESQGSGTWHFETRLPRRYGAVGATGEGLFANGAWYPQAVVDDGVPIVAWHVEVAFPPEITGALGDQVGTGTLVWTGEAERASLAAVKRGVITPIRGENFAIDLLTRGRPRPILVKELEAQLPLATVGAPHLSGAVVEGPLRRRLVRPGPGLVYVSDRAFRLTRPLQRSHRVPVTRGLLSGLIPDADPFEREIAAAAQSADHGVELRGAPAGALLRKFQWLPSINALLSSRTMPFYSDILDLTQPGDPVRDDLLEVLAPHTAGTIVLAQLDDTFGPGTGQAIGHAIARGEGAEEAARNAGLPPGWLDAWRVPYPVQDYTLDVDREAGTVTLVRLAPEDAPTETAILLIDGERHPSIGAAGERVLTLDRTPDKVVLDPDRHLGQLSRLGDAWPQRYQFTFASGISTINLTQFRILGAAWMTVRRTADTHNLFRGALYNGFTDIVGASIHYFRKEGPLKDGYARPHVFGASVNASLLNPRFADTDGPRPAMGADLSYAWDTRVSGDFPLRGRRLGISGGGGYVPGTGDQWSSGGLSAVGIGSWHPRHALAARLSGALAQSTIRHRLLALGGPGVMRSLPALPACPNLDEEGVAQDCQELATRRAFAAAEYRFAPLRNASIPLWLGWGSELQLTAGVETVAAKLRTGPAYAAGVTAGITGIGEAFGAEPLMLGLTFGWPVWWEGMRAPDRTTLGRTDIPLPEIYLRWNQAF